MVCMSIEVGCKKASRLVSSSQGVPEGLTAADVSRISSVTRESRCTGLCDNASRRLFATRASGAAQEKQLGEQKTFHKASRRGHSRAATGRGAGRAQCGNSTSTGGAERLHNNRLHQTCRPVSRLEHVCVERCPLTTRHTAARSGDSCGGTSADHIREFRRLSKLRRERAPEAEARNLTDQSIDSETPRERQGGNPGTTTMPTVRWPTELWGPEHPSSGAPRCLEGRREIFLSTC